MLKIHALSIRQPWAWAILNGKSVENRTWKTNFRGPFLIHASKKFDHDGYKWLVENQLRLGLRTIPHPKRFLMGGIVGQAEIVGCVTTHSSPYFFGPYGFVMTKIKPLPFQECKGRLGFFEVSYDKCESCKTLLNMTKKFQIKKGAS